MEFPENFVFSQGSLQNFVDCRRRFQLKYLRQQVWPALEVEPALAHELHGIMGQQFHTLIERYYVMAQYLPPAEAQALVGASIIDETLLAWWQAFLAEPPLNIPDDIVLPEARIVVELAGHKLVAIFDLLAIERNQRIMIVDWKTAFKRPTREMLAASLQTRVYPFAVAQGAAAHFGGVIDPARITMVYWYANFPSKPHVYHYSAAQYEADQVYLLDLLEAIDADLREETLLWEMTSDERRCQYCVFRSFCGRGVSAGEILDFESGFEDDVLVDFELLDELVY